MARGQRYGDDDEQGQRGDLDRDQDGVDRGTFLCADDQQDGDQYGDQHGRQVEDAADFTTLDETDGNRRSDREGVG